MAEVAYRPYRVLIAIDKDQSVNLACYRCLTIDGVDVKDGDAEPLAGMDDPIFVKFAEMFNAAAVADRDKWRAERDDALNKLAAMRAENASLRMMIDKLSAVTVDGK